MISERSDGITLDVETDAGLSLALSRNTIVTD
jgi:hypothetical protein